MALSLHTVQLLRRVGVWPLIKDQACPINDIRIADQDSSAALDFHHTEVGDEPFGWIIENRLFLDALLKRAGQLPSVKLLTSATVAQFDHDATQAKVILADGQSFKAPVLVGADGRKSITRAKANIDTYGWDYAQTALICNIAHEKPHNHIAVEHFLPGGPFAVLPMIDASTPGTKFNHRSSIVWTEKTAAATTLTALDDEDFTRLVQEKVAPYLGKMTPCQPAAILSAAITACENLYRATAGFDWRCRARHSPDCRTRL